MGLEPIRSRTRPSNVPVCQFQHYRAAGLIILNRHSACQPLFILVVTVVRVPKITLDNVKKRLFLRAACACRLARRLAAAVTPSPAASMRLVGGLLRLLAVLLLHIRILPLRAGLRILVRLRVLRPRLRMARFRLALGMHGLLRLLSILLLHMRALSFFIRVPLFLRFTRLAFRRSQNGIPPPRVGFLSRAPARWRQAHA